MKTEYGTMPEGSPSTDDASAHELCTAKRASNALIGYQPGGASNSSIGYRPPISEDNHDKYNPDMSGTSCHGLPVGYVKCTQTPTMAPGESTEADSLCNGLSPSQADIKIDLAQFLSHSGMSALQNNKLSMDFRDTPSTNPQQASPSAVTNKYGDSKHQSKDDDMQPPGQLVDNPLVPPGASVLDPNVTVNCHQPIKSPPSDLDRCSAGYVTAKQYSDEVFNNIQQDNISSCSVVLDEILEQGGISSDAEENPENSSWDSGYIGRDDIQKTGINPYNQKHQWSDLSHAMLA